MLNHGDLENSWQLITLIYFEFAIFFLSIYLFLFVQSHWDLENHLADWDEVGISTWGGCTVGGFYIIKIRIVGFFGLLLYHFLFVHNHCDLEYCRFN